MNKDNPSVSMEALVKEDQPASEEKQEHQNVIALLERLTPGITAIMLQALQSDRQLSDKLRSGALDLIDLYKLLEGKGRPPVPPTARAANEARSREFDAREMSSEAFNALQEQIRRGYRIV